MNGTAVLTPTTPIVYPVKDSTAEIILFITETHGYRVECRESGFVIREWSKTFESEADARIAARHAAKAYKLHKSAAAIERRRDKLAIVLGNRQKWVLLGTRGPVPAADLEREYDTLLDLDSFDGRAVLDETTRIFLTGLADTDRIAA